MLALVLLLAPALVCPAETIRYPSIVTIHRRPQLPGELASVQATLTLNGNPSYVQDSTGGAEVDGISTQGLKIGDQVIVTGEVEDLDTGLRFRNSRVELLWDGSPAPPLSVTAEDASSGKFAGLLVEVSSRYAGEETHDGTTWLHFDNGLQEFEARIPAERGSSLLPQMEVGSTVRVRGICSVQRADTRYRGGFAILLRSAEDASVLSGPPWWSIKHLVELGLLLAGLVIAAHLILMQMLKARYHAIMAERSRLGHELHDTLAQSFAGLAFQIQAAQSIQAVQDNGRRTNGRLAQHLDLALDMVRHSHAEAHRSIMMLRPQHFEAGTDLPVAIQTALDQSTFDCDLKATLIVTGQVERLPLMMTDALYRIAQEAIANALRHGHSKSLDVRLDYGHTSVCLTVVDDGVGFDIKSQHPRGFGLAGMRERARALRGNFDVLSELEIGTTVRAEFYQRPNLGASSLLALLPRLLGSIGRRIYGN